MLEGGGPLYPREGVPLTTVQEDGWAPGPVLIIKPNDMHYFSNLFDKVLYIFRTS
jgi:hypothetical protein